MILKTNGERLWDSLMEMATIGPGERGGSRRLALTDFDIEGRNLFRKWADEAGCTCRLDTMGNLFARRNGKIRKRPRYLLGVISTPNLQAEDLTEFLEF